MATITEKGIGFQLAVIIEDSEHGPSFRLVRNIPHIAGIFTPAEVLATSVLGYLNGLSTGLGDEDGEVNSSTFDAHKHCDNVIPLPGVRRPTGDENHAN